MAEERPAKGFVRRTWVETVNSTHHAGPEPRYLTLCGGAGPEIQMLIDAGVIARTETGAIDVQDSLRVIAVESSPQAVLELQKRYPGLKILDQSFQNIIKSSSPTNWPAGEHRRCCRAKVINLDWEGALSGSQDGGQIVFSDLDVVAKLAQLHGIAPPLDWTLFITYNATIDWSDEIRTAVFAFLEQNFSLDPEFRSECEDLLGASIVEAVEIHDTTVIDRLTKQQAQGVLMAFVPKKIAAIVHNEGWLVKTDRNLRYGGHGQAAPMVTFALSFTWDPRSSATPHVVYLDAVRGVLANVGSISDDGELQS